MTSEGTSGSATLGRRTTSVDIAKIAGVSQATVSRALNGGVVAQKTRQRVVALAEELGYLPNAVARGLVTNRTGLIGVVVGDITNPFYPEYLEVIGRRLAARGLQMLLQNATPANEAEVARLLLQQRVDGIVFTASLKNSATIRTLVDHGFPVVASNRVADVDCDAVEGDNVGGAAIVAELLVSLGHRRIGVIRGSEEASTSSERTIGFEDCLERQGVVSDPTLSIATDFSYQQAYDAARRLLGLFDPPSAIFCHNDLMAYGALGAARALHVKVPEELSVVGFDNIRQSSWETFDLTTVNQPIVEMAHRAIGLLEERIADPALPPRRESFPSDLVVRGTTGVARAAPGMAPATRRMYLKKGEPR